MGIPEEASVIPRWVDLVLVSKGVSAECFVGR